MHNFQISGRVNFEACRNEDGKIMDHDASMGYSVVLLSILRNRP